MDVSNENLNEIEAESHVCTICDLECTTVDNLRYHRNAFHVASENTDATQTIEIRLPVDSFITGQYIAKFKIGTNFKGIDTPDGCNVVHIESEDDFVRLKNPNDIDYSFHITTNYHGKKVHLACVKYDSAERCLRIDNHWTIFDHSIKNKYRKSVTLEHDELNELLNIELNELHFEGLDPNLSLSNLVKIRFNDGPICRIGFNRNKLSFVSYDK